ncbi:MAG: MFS family permease [Candidatus Azotimanducaceae bacterium]|jgi:MFS family permease
MRVSDSKSSVTSVIDDGEPEEKVEQFSSSYKWYTLGVLTTVYIFSFIDRQILVILQESIKTDLGLMDWQLGMLSGISFAIFYVVMGIPIARMADKGSRRNIVAVAIATWSLMTALSGMAQNFVHLLLARIGVAVGEAGGSPPAHSMISDIFPPQQRATALSIYSMGINFGVLIGFVIGGWVNDFFGWRTVFLVIGIPGIVWALVVRFTLREPRRGQSEHITKVSVAPPIKAIFALLWSRKSFRHLSVAAGLHAFVGYGVGQWIASFFIRTYELGSTGEIATWLGLISGTAGAAGTFLGGYLCDRFGVMDKRWYVWIPAGATIAAVPFSLTVYLLNDYSTALWVYTVPVLLGAMYLGPTIAMTHGIVSLRMRALASSILFFVLNLIGLGLGPLLTGILSDVLSVYYGDQGLRYALVIVVLVYGWSTFHYLMAGRTLREDLANAPS